MTGEKRDGGADGKRRVDNIVQRESVVDYVQTKKLLTEKYAEIITTMKSRVVYIRAEFIVI